MPQLDIYAFPHELYWLTFVFIPSFYFFFMNIISQLYLILRLRTKKFEDLIYPLRYNVKRSQNRTRKMKKLAVVRFTEIITELKEYNFLATRFSTQTNLITNLSNLNNVTILKTLSKIKSVIISN